MQMRLSLPLEDTMPAFRLGLDVPFTLARRTLREVLAVVWQVRRREVYLSAAWLERLHHEQMSEMWLFRLAAGYIPQRNVVEPDDSCVVWRRPRARS